nr:substrate-binding domain-containing protein [Oryzibacter oryziterrae]
MVLVGPTDALATGGTTIGVSWGDFREERWHTDQAALKAAVEAGGLHYMETDALSSAAKQLTDINSLIDGGADVLVIQVQDADLIAPALAKAAARRIPVIAYDRLIEQPMVFYISFDNREVGRQQARAVQAVRPDGNYVFIKGDAGDPNTELLYAGQLDILKPAIDTGKISVVGKDNAEGWMPANAHSIMRQFLVANSNHVDAAVVSNDNMAGGVISALSDQNRDGQVPVSGQDGDLAALNRVALGTQTVSVWKDSRALGRRAGEIAVQLAKGKQITDLPDVSVFRGGPKGLPIHAVLLTPIPITRDTLNVVLDAGWISKQELCKGVKRGMVKVCD